MHYGKQKATAYNPLPQFSESDSDIDIFNARSGGRNNKTVKYRRYSCKKHWTRKLFILIFLVLVSSLIAVYFTWYAKKFKVIQSPKVQLLTVRIDCGVIEGTKEQWREKNETYHSFSFYSIPYAQPPVGELRWKPSIPLNKSQCEEKVLNKKKKFVKCFQGYSGYEDCLYLNIFTPNLNETLLPVFVYIHGGSFLHGSSIDSNIRPNMKFAKEFNVVAVSMNYRLNAFGFLTLKELWDEGKSYGNYGIMDQILVLKWVQNNIKNFGGDPNSVVLFGYEAGGSSIYGLLSSPLVKNLFHKAVIIDGDPVIDENVNDLSQSFTMLLSNTTCKEILKQKECLHSLDSFSIWKMFVNTHIKMWQFQNDIPYHNQHKSLLAKDKIVLPHNPLESKSSVRNKKATDKIPLLIGSSAQVMADKAFPNNEKGFKEFLSYIEKRLRSYPQKFNIVKISELYHANNSTVNDNFQVLIADFLNVCRNNRFVDQYRYSMNYKPYRFIIGLPSSRDKSVALSTLFETDRSHNKQIENDSTKKHFKVNYFNMLKNFIHETKHFNENNIMFDKDGSMIPLKDEYHDEQCEYLNHIMFEES